MSFLPMTPIENLRNFHPWVNSLFSARIVQNLLIVGRLKHFLEGWEMLTKQPKILEIVKEFKIPFLECSVREKISQTRHMGQEDMRTEHAKEGSHTRDRASNWLVLSNISMVGKEMGETGLW